MPTVAGEVAVFTVFVVETIHPVALAVARVALPVLIAGYSVAGDFAAGAAVVTPAQTAAELTFLAGFSSMTGLAALVAGSMPGYTHTIAGGVAVFTVFVVEIAHPIALAAAAGAVQVLIAGYAVAGDSAAAALIVMPAQTAAELAFLAGLSSMTELVALVAGAMPGFTRTVAGGVAILAVFVVETVHPIALAAAAGAVHVLIAGFTVAGDSAAGALIVTPAQTAAELAFLAGFSSMTGLAAFVAAAVPGIMYTVAGGVAVFTVFVVETVHPITLAAAAGAVQVPIRHSCAAGVAGLAELVLVDPSIAVLALLTIGSARSYMAGHAAVKTNSMRNAVYPIAVFKAISAICMPAVPPQASHSQKVSPWQSRPHLRQLPCQL